MSCPGVGPCDPWPLVLCCLDDAGTLDDKCTLNGSPVPAAILDAAKLAASQLMWAATGRQFGQCTAKIRPCRQRDCDDSTLFNFLPSYGGGFQPALIGGEWFNIACGCPASPCCCSVCEVDIPYPACEIVEVKVDGHVLPASKYRIDDYRKLVRVTSPIVGPLAATPELHASHEAPPGPFPNADWCNVSPLPASTLDVAPLVGGCYNTIGAGGPVFDFPAGTQSFQATFGRSAGGIGAAQFTLVIPEFTSPLVTWPMNAVPMTTGEVRESVHDSSGRFVRITYVGGSGTGPRSTDPLFPQQMGWSFGSGTDVPEMMRWELFGPLGDNQIQCGMTAGTPFIPGTPGTPFIPGTPGTPFIPGTPGTPFIPGTPGTPAIPGVFGPATVTGVDISGTLPAGPATYDGVGPTGAEIDFTNPVGAIQFTIDPQSAFAIPNAPFVVVAQDPANAPVGPTGAEVATAFGVPVNGATQVTGPVTGAPTPSGAVVEVVSGTVRISDATGSPFAVNPGDTGLPAVIRITWPTLVHGVKVLYGNKFETHSSLSSIQEAPLGTPAVPGTPDIPATPGTPDIPAVPATPDIPATPGTPDIPAVPGVSIFCTIPDCWPECQTMDLPDTEVGTWSVTLKYGRPIPELVLLATADLACELIKACANQPCRLPQRVQSVARQGVNMSFIDSMSMLKDGLTGLYLADMAITTYNPYRLQGRPSVWSPDAEQWRTPTG